MVATHYQPGIANGLTLKRETNEKSVKFTCKSLSSAATSTAATTSSKNDEPFPQSPQHKPMSIVSVPQSTDADPATLTLAHLLLSLGRNSEVR